MTKLPDSRTSRYSRSLRRIFPSSAAPSSVKVRPPTRHWIRSSCRPTLSSKLLIPIAFCRDELEGEILREYYCATTKNGIVRPGDFRTQVEPDALGGPDAPGSRGPSHFPRAPHHDRAASFRAAKMSFISAWLAGISVLTATIKHASSIWAVRGNWTTLEYRSRPVYSGPHVTGHPSTFATYMLVAATFVWGTPPRRRPARRRPIENKINNK